MRRPCAAHRGRFEYVAGFKASIWLANFRSLCARSDYYGRAIEALTRRTRILESARPEPSRSGASRHHDGSSALGRAINRRDDSRLLDLFQSRARGTVFLHRTPSSQRGNRRVFAAL